MLYAFCPSVAQAGTPLTEDSKHPIVGPPPAASRWKIGVGYAPMFNSSVAFSGRSPGINGAPPLGTGPVFDEYDDGFVRPDISGDTSLTTNWSYLNDSQYDPADGGSLAFTSSARNGALPSAFRSEDEADGELGFEVFADLTLGRIGGPNAKTSWGIHFGFHYADLDADEASSSSAGTTRSVDRFPLGGVIPPLAPYTGSFTGPGPLLDTNATRITTTLPGGASVARSNELDADLFSLNVGSWIAFAPTEKFSLQAQAGFTLAFADATYRSASSTSLPGGNSAAIGSRTSETKFLPGFYVGASAAYAITERLDVYLSARYQYLDSLFLGSANSRAELSFNESFILSTGLRFSF